MKRSQQLKIGLVMLPASAALIGCGEDTDALIFSSLNECIQSGLLSTDVCQKAYEQSKLQHQSLAPRFTSASDCEVDFGTGRCQSISDASGGSWFIPMMAGFMASQVIQGMTQPGSAGAWPEIDIDIHKKHKYRTQPLYKTYGSTKWMTSGADILGKGTGKVKIDGASSWAPAKSTTMKRGGFGSMASARGSWGS